MNITINRLGGHATEVETIIELSKEEIIESKKVLNVAKSIPEILEEINNIEALDMLTGIISDYVEDSNPMSDAEAIDIELTLWTRITEAYYWILLKN